MIVKKLNSIKAMSFFWNALYSGFSAIQSFIILIAVSRKEDLAEAGIVTIGFTIAVLCYIVAVYGIRNYQVTDVSENYSFSDYFWARMMTVFGSFFCVMPYVIAMIINGRYSLHKGVVITEIVVLKLVDAFESLYVGRLQQIGRLDVGSRTATIRIVISTLIVFLFIWMDNDITVSFAIGISVSVLVDLVLLPRGRKYASMSIKLIEFDKVKNLLVVTFPLFIGTALHNYLGNAPKYLTDLYLNDDIQAISGYIMMPMFVITVLNSFLMQPTVKPLGDAWKNRNITLIRNMIVRHLVLIGGASVVVLFAGIFIGLPLLSWVYNVNLLEYKKEFSVIMLGGILYTFSAYGMVILTAMRRQKWIVWGCISALAVYSILGFLYAEANGLIGISIIYVVSNLALMTVFVAGVIKNSI